MYDNVIDLYKVKVLQETPQHYLLLFNTEEISFRDAVFRLLIILNTRVITVNL